MIPRMHLDISWMDIIRSWSFCIYPSDESHINDELENIWCNNFHPVNKSFLSVRSGFDALLSALDFPPGSEILVSAITIPGMIQIIEEHNLVPIPIDLDLTSQAISNETLSSLISDKTKAILIAHLFGDRFLMEPIIEFARKNNLSIFEDCAQAFAGKKYLGDPDSDVVMFSFGTIKTSTTMGGALFRFRDKELANESQKVQENYSRQITMRYFLKSLKISFLKILSNRFTYSIFFFFCKTLSLNHDQIIANSVKGFSEKSFFSRIRQQPCRALLATMLFRLKNFDQETINNRIKLAIKFRKKIDRLNIPFHTSLNHTFWVFPVLHEEPDKLIEILWKYGFDATRGNSSMVVVENKSLPSQFTPQNAKQSFEKIFYLPFHPDLKQRDLNKLEEILKKQF